MFDVRSADGGLRIAAAPRSAIAQYILASSTMPLVLYGIDGPLWVLSDLRVESIDADIQVMENADGCPPACCRRRGVCPPEKTYTVRIVIETKTDILAKTFSAPTLEAANTIMASAIEVAALLEDKVAEPIVQAHKSLVEMMPISSSGSEASSQAGNEAGNESTSEAGNESTSEAGNESTSESGSEATCESGNDSE